MNTKNISLLIVLTVMVVVFVPSNRSLWVDEGYTALNALEPTFESWVKTFPVSMSHDPLKPIEGLATFGFSRVTGASELALRYHNALWIVLGVLSCAIIGRMYGLVWLPFLFLVHPFVWYYFDEVRPYAMQLGGGALLLWGSLGILRAQGKCSMSWLVYLLGSILLSGSSLLGGIPVAFSFFALVTVGHFQRWKLARILIASIVIFGLSQSAFLGYYIWQMLLWQGGEASRQWDVGILNIAYSIFEFLGLSGLGPSREVLRATIKSDGLSQGLLLFVSPWSFAMVAIGCLWGLLAYGIFRALRSSSTNRLPILFSFAIIISSTLFLFFGAIAFKWPFWGRHLAGIFPWFLFLALMGTAREGRFRILVPVALGILLAASSLRWAITQNPYREDYRNAAILAKEALVRGEVVWWLGSGPVSDYYRVPIQSESSQGVYANEQVTANGQMVQLPEPHIVLINRPDILDPGNKIRTWLLAKGYKIDEARINGFSVFTRS